MYKLSCPTFFMNTEKLDYTDGIKYLGFTFSSENKDDNDMLRQMTILYIKSNRLLRYSTVVQLMLNLFYFVDTVLSFVAHFYGLLTRSLLIASLELLPTMSIVAY